MLHETSDRSGAPFVYSLSNQSVSQYLWYASVKKIRIRQKMKKSYVTLSKLKTIDFPRYFQTPKSVNLTVTNKYNSSDAVYLLDRCMKPR